MSIVALYVIILPFFVCVPLILGIYTYRDAKSRGMNALLWAFLAALAPTFLVLILYLLVRGNYSNLRCARCGQRVEASFTVCPQCGVKLRALCGGCGAPAEAGWKVCPRCARPLDWESQQATPPVRPRDKGLGKILLVVILVPVLFLILLAVGFSVRGSVGAVHTVCYEEAEMILLAHEEGIDLRAFRDKAREEEDALYALSSQTPAGEDVARFSYVVYLPHTAIETVASGHSVGLLGTKILAECSATEDEKGVFLAVTAIQEKEPKLQIRRDGEKLPVHIIQSPESLEAFVILE